LLRLRLLGRSRERLGERYLSGADRTGAGRRLRLGLHKKSDGGTPAFRCRGGRSASRRRVTDLHEEEKEMTMKIDRRRLLQGTAALAGTALLPLSAFAQEVRLRGAWWGSQERTTRTLAVADLYEKQTG